MRLKAKKPTDTSLAQLTIRPSDVNLKGSRTVQLFVAQVQTYTGSLNRTITRHPRPNGAITLPSMPHVPDT